MEPKSSINLIPEVPEEEVKKVKKKGKLNLFGVVSVFLVIFVTVFILLADLFVHVDLNRKKDRLKETENEITSLSYIELKQKTLVTKVGAFISVNDHDFSSEIVLRYLLEVAGQLSTVTTMYLDDAMVFRISGYTDSYMNVARIWHQMCQQRDYFRNVNLEQVSMMQEEANEEIPGGYRVGFTFTGEMVRENVDDL